MRWNQIQEKLAYLKSMDQTFQLFGADYHEYCLHPPVTEFEIKRVEAGLGITLPAELRAFYTVMGNGVAGPHYGLKPLQNIRGYQADKPYQGVSYFKQIAVIPEDEEGYFEIRHKEIHGLITIIEEGCGHQTCLISTGEKIGNIVRVSGDGYVTEEDCTLITLYNNWLDSSIQAFETVKPLLATTLSMTEICDHIQKVLNRYDGQDLAVSLLGVQKPESLFGTRHHRRYGGADQAKWYDEQLADYRSNQLAT